MTDAKRSIPLGNPKQTDELDAKSLPITARFRSVRPSQLAGRSHEEQQRLAKSFAEAFDAWISHRDTQFLAIAGRSLPPATRRVTTPEAVVQQAKLDLCSANQRRDLPFISRHHILNWFLRRLRGEATDAFRENTELKGESSIPSAPAGEGGVHLVGASRRRECQLTPAEEAAKSEWLGLISERLTALQTAVNRRLRKMPEVEVEAVRLWLARDQDSRRHLSYNEVAARIRKSRVMVTQYKVRIFTFRFAKDQEVVRAKTFVADLVSPQHTDEATRLSLVAELCEYGFLDSFGLDRLLLDDRTRP
jgi:hypothetical protein